MKNKKNKTQKMDMFLPDSGDPGEVPFTMHLFGGSEQKFKNFFKNKKGQLSIENIIFLFLAIVMLGTLVPVMQSFVDVGINGTNNTMVHTLLDMFIPLLVMGLFIVVFRYSAPLYSQRAR